MDTDQATPDENEAHVQTFKDSEAQAPRRHQTETGIVQLRTESQARSGQPSAQPIDKCHSHPTDKHDNMTARSKGSQRYLQQSPDDSETSQSTDNSHKISDTSDDEYDWTNCCSPPHVEVDMLEAFETTTSQQPPPWNSTGPPMEHQDELGSFATIDSEDPTHYIGI
jgi:hypothetical protein